MILNLNNPDQSDVEHEQMNFLSGESFVKLKWVTLSGCDDDAVEIHFRYRGDGSLIKLLMVTDALKRSGYKKIDLKIPYFPGGRQDRVCNWGEPLSVKVYADLINSQNYNSVTVFDPHSDVTAALLNNVRVVNNHEFVKGVINELFPTQAILREFIPPIIVSPDAGAMKKISALSEFFNFSFGVVRADKKRDTKTGKLSGFEVYSGDLAGKTCLVIDDVISRGGTFTGIAQKLKEKNAEKIILIVSHYEGVADHRKLKEAGIDKLFCTNSLAEKAEDEFFKQRDVFQYL